MKIDFYYTGNDQPIQPGHFQGGVGVYLHGQAEDEVGYDIPDSGVDLHQLEDGIYPATVNAQEGYTLFLWRSSSRPGLRGLVAKNSDEKGVADCQQRYERRTSFL